MSNQKPEENPYFVEVDDNGCSKCGAGRTWVVVDHEGVRGATSYGLEEDAQDLAEDLNRAFNVGLHTRENLGKRRMCPACFQTYEVKNGHACPERRVQVPEQGS